MEVDFLIGVAGTFDRRGRLFLGRTVQTQR